jgi:GTP cyclohydrolase II
MPPGLSRGNVPLEIALAAVGLAKLARLLPAAVVAPLRLESAAQAATWARSRDLLDVSIRAIDGYQVATARSLKIASEARVPLAGAEAARVIAFRPGDGGTEHLAIIIGEPPRDRPVLTPSTPNASPEICSGACAATAATSFVAPSPRSHGAAMGY